VKAQKRLIPSIPRVIVVDAPLPQEEQGSTTFLADGAANMPWSTLHLPVVGQPAPQPVPFLTVGQSLTDLQIDLNDGENAAGWDPIFEFMRNTIKNAGNSNWFRVNETHTTASHA
jgi:hypothetical protein